MLTAIKNKWLLLTNWRGDPKSEIPNEVLSDLRLKEGVYRKYRSASETAEVIWAIIDLLILANEVDVFDFTECNHNVENTDRYANSCITPSLDGLFNALHYGALDKAIKGKKFTLRGNFFLDRGLRTPQRTLFSSCTIEGKLWINRGNENKMFELPPNMVITGGIYDTNIYGIHKYYWETGAYNAGYEHREADKLPLARYFATMEEYQNRPERLERLEKQRQTRQEIKDINASGLLEFPDNYDMPLEIGNKVAYWTGGSVRLGYILGQTEHRLLVQDSKTKSKNHCYSNEVVRL